MVKVQPPVRMLFLSNAVVKWLEMTNQYQQKVGYIPAILPILIIDIAFYPIIVWLAVTYLYNLSNFRMAGCYIIECIIDYIPYEQAIRATAG